MKPIRSLLAVTLLSATLLSAVASQHAVAADPVGVRTLSIPAPERGAEIGVTLWYPAASGGTPILVGDNAVFIGTPAARDAPIAGGRFPVILLAHGGLRAAPNLDGWIAARLAAQGFLVAEPHPPAPAHLEARDAPREIWLRPADLSATLTALAQDPDLAGHIDAQAVSALGFRLGGTSVLALAGARLDLGSYASSCDEGPAGPDCAWFEKHGVDLHAIDPAKLGRSHRDPRVTAAIAVDPEFAASFTAGSLAGIAIPVQLIALGRPDTTGDAATRIPRARGDVIPEATPFDAFSACKPEGPAILRADGDGTELCDAAAGHREAIHARLAALIAAALQHQPQSGL